MKSIEVAAVTGSLSEYAREGLREPVLVTRRGKAVFVVIPLSENDDRESVSLATDPRFMRIIERSRARARSEGTRSLEALRRRHGLTPKAGRSRPRR